MIAINCTEKTSTYCETNLIDVGLMKLRGRTRSGQSCGVGLGLARIAALFVPCDVLGGGTSFRLKLVSIQNHSHAILSLFLSSWCRSGILF